MKKKVIIVGYGFTSRLGMIRAIAETGAEISIIVMEQNLVPLDSFSKYVDHTYICDGDHEETLMRILLKECIDNEQKPVLIPLNDFSAEIIDRHTDSLKGHYIFPNIHYRQGALLEWMNKEKQKALAQSVGLNVTHAVNVDIKDGNYEIPEGVVYPCFTKTRTYMLGYKHTLQKCANEQELRSKLDILIQDYPTFTMMVEDYQAIETEYAVVGVTDGKEVIIPGVLEIQTMGYGRDKGVACQGKIMPVTGFEDLIEKFKEVMLQTGFVGLFDIDFYLCGGKYYFGEINLRIGGSGYAVTRMGVNLPAIYIHSVLGESTDGMKKEITETGIFCNERICMDNWYEGYFSSIEYRKMIKTSDFGFIKDEKDPEPEKIFKKRMRKRVIKRIIKQCLFMQPHRSKS